MALTDPFPSVSLNSVVQTLPRVSTVGTRSTYRQEMVDATHPSLLLTISHDPNASRIRSMAKLEEFVDVNADNVLERAMVQITFECPPIGFTLAQKQQLCRALIDALTASSDATLLKFLGQQS